MNANPVRPVTRAELHAELSDIRGGLARLDERVGAIEKHGATKSDIAATEIRLLDRLDKNLKWTIGTAIVLASAIVAGIGVLA